MAGDEVFKAQQASLQKALSDYMAQDTADTTRYGEDFDKAVDGLGYRAPVVDNPATTMDESLGGGWDFQDQNKSSGRAYQNQVNDFAGRGMLQSTMYSTALDNLKRSLNDQYTGLNAAKTSFTNDKSRARTAYQNENSSAGNGARAESMARYAAIYGAL